MIRLLLKKQMAETFRSYFFDAKKNRMRPLSSVILYFVLFVLLIAGLCGGMFGLMAAGICKPLAEIDAVWFYYAIMGIISLCMGTFGAVFNSYGSLYKAKDNELLLSMPISASSLLASRLLNVYLLSLLYSAIASVPAVIIYIIVEGVHIRNVLGGILYVLELSLAVTVVSCILGWITARLSNIIKRKSLVTVAVSIAFIAIYYYFILRLQNFINTVMYKYIEYGDAVKDNVYPLYLIGKIGEGCVSIAELVLVLSASATAAMITWVVLKRSYLKITMSSGRNENRKSVRRDYSVKSVSGALFSREMSHFISSPIYMLNCGIGIVVMIFGAAAMIIKAEIIRSSIGIFAEILGSPDAAAAVMIMAVSAMAMMNDITAPSVSLEGKNIWIIQSLPVSATDILKAKLRLHIVLSSIPALICSICACFVLKSTLEPFIAFLIAAVPQTFILLSACFGLFMNLKNVNLTWSSEIIPIKQNLTVFIALLGGILYAAAAAAVYAFASGYIRMEIYLTLLVLVNALLSALLYRWIVTRGAAIFESL